MDIKLESMTIKTTEDGTELHIKGQPSHYLFTEKGIEFYKKIPQILTEVCRNEQEYDRLYNEFRNKLSKFLNDEKAIIEIIDLIKKKIGL